MKTAAATVPSTNSAVTTKRPLWVPIPSSPTSSRPKVAAFRTALIQSNLWPDNGVIGSERTASHQASSPNGTLNRNSQCQDATARIAAAIVGPAAEDVATTSATVATPRPS